MKNEKRYPVLFLGFISAHHLTIDFSYDFFTHSRYSDGDDPSPAPRLPEWCLGELYDFFLIRTPFNSTR